MILSEVYAFHLDYGMINRIKLPRGSSFNTRTLFFVFVADFTRELFACFVTLPPMVVAETLLPNILLAYESRFPFLPDFQMNPFLLYYEAIEQE